MGHFIGLVNMWLMDGQYEVLLLGESFQVYHEMINLMFCLISA
jgi:hypothetical protein